MGSLVKEYRVFPTGDTFKATETVNNIDNGTSVTVSDPGPFYEAPPEESEYDYCIYSRLFWNAAGSIKSGSSVNVKIQGNTVVTCWYQHGCSPGGGPNAISTYTFDVATNSVLDGVTPIASVTPGGLWTSPSTSVTPSANQIITIDARDNIGVIPFSKWMTFGSGSPSGDDVIIPAGGGGFYIAFYMVPKSDGPGFDLGHLLEWLEKVPSFDFEEIADPSPLDKLRFAVLMAKMAQSTAPAAAGGQDTAAARQALARVRSELKRLEAREKALSAQVEYIER